jgi:hypothetical protein
MNGQEVWKDVVGWEGFYQVSSLGRVRSVDRVITQKSRWGIQNRLMRGKILKACSCTNGYLFVALSKPGTKPKPNLIHRLVAFSFHGHPSAGHEVCHNNGIRTDNRVINIRWDSRKSNHSDKATHGTDLRGEKNPMCKLNTQKVTDMRSSTLTLRELSEIYGVTEGTISKIRNMKAWSWV